jgi:hypothetical protein
VRTERTIGEKYKQRFLLSDEHPNIDSRIHAAYGYQALAVTRFVYNILTGVDLYFNALHIGLGKTIVGLLVTLLCSDASEHYGDVSTIRPLILEQ